MHIFELEIKRTSITRLKPSRVQLTQSPTILEIKRTSITRLKHVNHTMRV